MPEKLGYDFALYGYTACAMLRADAVVKIQSRDRSAGQEVTRCRRYLPLPGSAGSGPLGGANGQPDNAGRNAAALDLPDTVTDAELQPICDSATDLVVRLLVPADYAGNPTICEAVLTVATQIYQQRQTRRWLRRDGWPYKRPTCWGLDPAVSAA